MQKCNRLHFFRTSQLNVQVSTLFYRFNDVKKELTLSPISSQIIGYKALIGFIRKN